MRFSFKNMVIAYLSLGIYGAYRTSVTLEELGEKGHRVPFKNDVIFFMYLFTIGGMISFLIEISSIFLGIDIFFEHLTEICVAGVIGFQVLALLVNLYILQRCFAMKSKSPVIVIFGCFAVQNLMESVSSPNNK